METRMNLRSKVLVFACSLAALIGMATVGGLRLAYAEPAAETKPAEVKSSTSDVSKNAAKRSGNLAKPLQGAKHNRVTSYHAKFPPPWSRMSEVWAQLNPDGTPLRARVDYPETEDGPKVVIFSKGRSAVWFKDKRVYSISPENNSQKYIAEMLKFCDPNLAFEQLQARKKAGRVKIETKEPAKVGDVLTLTVTPQDVADQREVYEVNPTTKRTERVTYYRRQGAQWKEAQVVECLVKEIDPKVF